MTEIKLTPKQEKFCLVYMETGNASEAYRQSYNVENMKSETINRNAFAQLENSKIATRIEQIRQEHQQRHNVTIDSLTDELDQIKDLSICDKQYSSAVSSVMGKAKIHGFDKSTIKLELPMVVRKDLSGKELQDGSNV